MTPQETWKERFDKQFGITIRDDDDFPYSLGRAAGCDDCETSHEIRAEHKNFIASELARRDEEWREVIEGMRKDTRLNQTKSQFQRKHGQGYNRALSDILAAFTGKENGV